MSDRFDKFTHDARNALHHAQEEARRLNHDQIGPEHILLGLLRETNTVASVALKGRDLDLRKARSAVESITGRGDRKVTEQKGLTPRAKRVIELAVDEARDLNHDYIGSEHILLGLLREGTEHGQGMLERLNIRPIMVRRVLLMLLESVESPDAPSHQAQSSHDQFDKFTERARKVLQLAQEEAQRFNHNYIGTEHILLGLVREGDGVAARVLNNLGIELHKVRSAVEFIIGRGDRMVMGEIGLTPRAKRVIELAVDEARRLNHHYIGTEHLLLGLVREGEGIAAGVLESLGVSLEKVRAQVIEVLKSSGDYSYTTSSRMHAEPSEPPISIVRLIDDAYSFMGLDKSEVFAVPGTPISVRKKKAGGQSEPEATELARIVEMVDFESQADFEDLVDRVLKLEGVSFDDPMRIYLREIARSSPLDPPEETALIEVMSQGRAASDALEIVEKRPAGDDLEDHKKRLHDLIDAGSQARERLLQAGLGRVVSIALLHMGKGLALLDMTSEGNTGLMKAVDTFDPSSGYDFPAYSAWWINKAITQAVRDQTRTVHIPAHVVELVARVHRATHKLLRQALREPTVGELARELRMPPERVRKILDFVRALASLSAQAGYANYGPTEFGTVVPSEEQAERHALLEQVKSVLPEMPDDERQIVARFYGLADGHMRTLGEVAQELGISRGLVRQVIARLHRRLNP
jgi:RNA polymerase sigma factor (sigma-70 family)